MSEITLYNYEKIETDLIEKIIVKISESEGAAENLAKIIRLNYDKLDEKNRNKIIIKLMGKDKAKKDMAFVVIHNYKKLPKSIMDSIGEIREQIQDIIKEYSSSDEDSLFAIASIVGFWQILDSHFVANTLNEIKLGSNSDAVEAAEKILQILSQHIDFNKG